MNGREQFLIHMYDQMFNDINRHIMVVWQSISLVIGAFAVFALVEKEFIPLDIAIAIIVLSSLWLLAHLEDASYWYNRNLAIIANIERQFLLETDLRNIHYYFGKHRDDNSMIGHLKIQYVFGVAVALLVLLYHLSERVMPAFNSDPKSLSLVAVLPYLSAAVAGSYVWCRHRKNIVKYSEFLSNSPGISVDREGIVYGDGHGRPPTTRRMPD